MTLKEAYRILGVSKENTDREIRAKYKKLLIMYHPDSDPTGKRDPKDDEMIRLVIEAYNKIRESEGMPVYETYEFTWDAFENKEAFAERNIFVQFRIYDEALPPSKMARGRFAWDPDMEEFSLFAKSVLEACREVMADSDAMADTGAAMDPNRVKNVFHLMMQEYVLPADAARKLGKRAGGEGNAAGEAGADEGGNGVAEDERNGGEEVYSFSGFIKSDATGGGAFGSGAFRIHPGELLDIFLQEDRAIVREIVSGKVLGSITFDEDELYYVVLPLLEDPKVDARAYVTKADSARRGKERIHVAIELTIPADLADTPVSNRNLIREMLGLE
ncbi:J domain-containing protein [Butyrivibrio sp. FCS014]|uniref:J domain-containing protein n=1 Tax=Butyrivibrio sp. FCS014 TaxID=1408304 RepID=UPI00046718F6|nr:DnaJ domain-containing protein [Butyrivibrio sp. FCS014]